MSIVGICGKIWSFIKWLLIFIIYLIFLPSIPLGILAATPIYLYRYLVSVLSKYLRPDLVKILTTRSSIFAVDDLYAEPRAPLVVFMIIDGDIKLQQGQSFLKERLIDACWPNGERVRPELSQYITRWAGFYFWKSDPDFSIKNHVRDYDGPQFSTSYDESTLYLIANELVAKAFPKKRSPWELLLLHNCVDESGESTTAVVLKVHHSIADGFTILKLVGELITSKGRIFPILPESQVFRSTFFGRIFDIVGLCFLAPYHTVKTLVGLYDFNEWHISESKLSRRVNGAVLEKFSIDYIKEIKNLGGVKFTSVLIEAFAGGVRNFMIECGVKVPKDIHCLAPLPMLGHPDKMRNYMTLCWITLPVGIADPIQRLHCIDKHLKELARNTFPIFAFYMIPFIGGLFPFLIKIVAKQFFVTAIMSNFPGPPDEVFYQEMRVKDMIFTGGMLPGNIGMGLTSISYNGSIRIAAGIDESIVPPQIPIQGLIDKIYKELHILKSELSI